MPLTDEQKTSIITQMGYNPAEYDVDEATQSLVSRQPSTQPSSSPTTYQPKLQGGARPIPQQSSALGAFGTSALEAAPGAIASGIGAGIMTGTIGGELNPLAHVFPPYSEIASGFIGAIGGGLAARGIQKAVEPEAFQQQVAQAQQQHPIASLAGGIATLPLGGFGPNSIENFGSAAGAIPKLLAGQRLLPNELAQVTNIGLGAGIGAAQPIAESLASGQGMPSIGSIAGNAALGGIFSKPNAIGHAYGFHDVDVPDEVFTKNLLQAMGKEPTPKPVEAAPLTEPAKPTTPQEDIANLTPEDLDKVVAGEKTKLQEKTNISTQAEKDVAEKLKEEGKTGNLTQGWYDASKALGEKRGVDLKLNPDLETAGQFNPETREAQINPDTAGADSPIHEIYHGFRDTLLNSGRARDEQFVNKYDSLVEQSPDYVKWAEARKAANKNSSVEEYQTTNQGVESINRALSNETKFQKWKNDFSSYIKTRFGKHGTEEDFRRVANYKLLTDPSYYKLLGLKAPVTAGIRQQEESNLRPESRLPQDKDETGKVNELYKSGDITLDQAEKLLVGNPKNQEESNLVSPKHDSVVTALDEGVKNSDDATITPERADELTNALKTQVKWPTESRIPDILKSKEFDNLDPDHWNQLRKIYNNEYDTYGKTISKEVVKPENKTQQVEPKTIEVPRVIPEVATEASKSAAEVKPSSRGSRTGRTTEELPYTPGEKVTGKELAGKVKPLDFSSLRKETVVTPEEKARDLAASKMSWDEIDKTTNPQETMDKLKQQYDSFGDRQHEAYGQGDKDTANKLADLRTATLMRMHYLGEKKGIEVPKDMSKYQEESNLKSNKDYIGDARNGLARGVPSEDSMRDTHEEHNFNSGWRYKAKDNTVYWDYKPDNDEKHSVENFLARKGINDVTHRDVWKYGWPGELPEKYQEQSNLKLPDLHNRVEEFGKKSPEEPLGYITPKMFTTQLDKIRKTGGETGKQMADTYEKYAPMKDQLYGKYWAPIQKALKGLSVGDKERVENIGILENRDKKFYNDQLTPKQKALYDAVKASLKQKQEDQIEAGQLVTDYKNNGVKFQRPAQIDPYYWPNKISPKVAEQLADNTPSAQKLKEDFLSHQKNEGISEKIAERKLQSIESAYDSAQPNMTRFGAVREAEGVGLPDSWMRNGIEKNLGSYFNRVAADRAFHDTFESNKDLYNAAFKGEDSGDLKNIKGNKYASQLAEQIHGEPFDKDESWIKAFNRVATSLMLGPLTNVHIAASSVANSLQYLRPTEAIPAIAKSIIHITDGYAKAVETGRIKPSNTAIRDVVDVNNTAVERWRAASDVIGKLNGRNITNDFTNSFLQNIGDWIVRSKAIAASGGDKSAIDLMRRIDPDWTVNKEYTTPDFDKLASNFAGIIHGSHDARTLPGWMLKDTAIQPFFSLASWNIAQTNAWFRHVLTPAKEGNFTPLIMSTLGAALGGYVIKQGRELIADKKSPIPSLSEIVNSSRGAEGNLPMIAYNLAAMSSYVGYAGILSVAAKAGFDLANKNIPQAATFPLDETIGNSVHRISQAAAALMNDPNANYAQVGSRLAIDLAKENVQLGRLMISWASNSPQDIVKQVPGLEQEQYSKQLNSKTQDLRRFKMVEGMPYDEQSVSESNPYLSSALKSYKRSQDIGESAQEIPQLFQAALTKANGNPDVLKAELHKIKANTYDTMPSPDTMPLSFVRYLNFLRKTEGPEEASNRLVDYMKHRAINEAKSSMVPSL